MGEEVCRWCLATGSRSSSLGIKPQLFPLGPSPPGERWGWPESCRQLEVINPAGSPSQAPISETLWGRKEGDRDSRVCVSLSWQRNIRGRILSPSCAKEKHSRVGVTHPYCSHLSFPTPSPGNSNIPGHPVPPLLPPMLSPGGFLHPEPGLWGHSVDKTMNMLSLEYLIRDIQR